MWSKTRLAWIYQNLEGLTNHPGLYAILVVVLAVSLVACSSSTPPDAPMVTIQSIDTVTPTEVTLTPTAQHTSTATHHPTETPSSTPDYFSQAYPLSENEYVIPLTVRSVTDARAIFFFELQNLTDGMLVYRNVDTQIQGEIAISADETRHMVAVEGLTPGTAHEALVFLGNEDDGFQQPSFAAKEWGAINFRTASDEWPLRVGVLGDASFGDEATQELVNLIAVQDLDFVIHTGDVVYETDSSDLFNSYLLKFFKPFSPLLHQGPVYTVLGNHDYDSAVRWEGAPFYDYVFPPFPNPDFRYPEARRGNQYYALSYQDIQFLMLDTHVFAGAESRSVQDTWIEERLADPRFRVTIPVFHVAPFSSSVVHPDDGLPVRYSWNWRFEEANVPLSLSGHFHHYERLIANGITYIVSGGGSSTLYAQGELLPESQIYARKTHFVLLEIYEDYVDLTAITLDGEIIDQATIPLN